MVSDNATPYPSEEIPDKLFTPPNQIGKCFPHDVQGSRTISKGGGAQRRLSY